MIIIRNTGTYKCKLLSKHFFQAKLSAHHRVHTALHFEITCIMFDGRLMGATAWPSKSNALFHTTIYTSSARSTCFQILPILKFLCILLNSLKFSFNAKE